MQGDNKLSSLSDKTLMFEVRDGDPEKLGLLFQRHHKALYNFFLRMSGSVESSEDLVQEVFFRMLKYKHTYRGDSEFFVWMYRIARNTRVDYYRKRKLQNSDENTGDELASQDLNPWEGLEKNQQAQLVRKALNRLDEDEREVLLLSRFENMKYKEIAGLLGCREGTVKARVFRAIKRLRDVYFELSGED